MEEIKVMEEKFIFIISAIMNIVFYFYGYSKGYKIGNFKGKEKGFYEGRVNGWDAGKADGRLEVTNEWLKKELNKNS